MNIFKRVITLFWMLQDYRKYARHIGVKVGNNCLIATRNWGSEPYLITIGDSVQVTQDVYFHTHGGSHVVRTFYPNFDVFGKIVIEDGAYIGSGSHIMPGVTIGKNAMIAAGSIVTHSVPSFEVWGGVPAKKISSVEEYLQKNLAYNTDTKGLDYRSKKKILLSLPDDKFIKK